MSGSAYLDREPWSSCGSILTLQKTWENIFNYWARRSNSKCMLTTHRGIIQTVYSIAVKNRTLATFSKHNGYIYRINRLPLVPAGQVDQGDPGRQNIYYIWNNIQYTLNIKNIHFCTDLWASDSSSNEHVTLPRSLHILKTKTQSDVTNWTESL